MPTVTSSNPGFITGDTVSVVLNKPAFEMQMYMIMAYYAWDLYYPKKYQLLGLLQIHIHNKSQRQLIRVLIRQVNNLD